MASTKRIALLLALLALAVPLGYAVVLIRQARLQMPAVVGKATALEATALSARDLPEQWKNILLRVEDPGFYQHNGVDLSTPGAGFTTITQSLVKGHFDGYAPGLHAKMKQTINAMVLDRGMDKDLQLTLFLNTASFGPAGDIWINGFPASARAYFGKPFLELDRREFITLVAMLIGPMAFHPTRTPDALADRVARIEALLAGDCEPTGLGDVHYEACAR